MKTLKLYFLHGFMGSPEEAHFLNVPCDFNLEVKAPNLRGLLNEKSVEAIREDFIAFNPDLLYGYSMGGRLALDLVTNTPGLKKSNLKYVVLESAALENLPAPQAQQRIAQDELRSLEIERDFPTFLKGWYQLSLWGQLTQSQREELATKRREDNRDHLHDLSRQIKFMSPGRYLLPGVERWPRHLAYSYFCGEEDKKYWQMIKGFPIPQDLNFTWKSCPAVGHNIHFQAPEFIMKTLSKWITP